MGKTLAKTVSYRVVSTASTMAVTFALTGSLEKAASVGVVNAVLNSGLYFAFESVWGRLQRAEVLVRSWSHG